MTSGYLGKWCPPTITSVCRSTWRTSPQRSRCHRHRRKGKCQKIFQGLGDQLGNAETLPEEHIERRRRGRELGRAEKMFKQVDLKIQAKVMCRDMLYKTIKQVFAWLFCIVFIFVNGLEFTDNSMTIQRRPLFSDRYHRTTITYLFIFCFFLVFTHGWVGVRPKPNLRILVCFSFFLWKILKSI